MGVSSDVPCRPIWRGGASCCAARGDCPRERRGLPLDHAQPRDHNGYRPGGKPGCAGKPGRRHGQRVRRGGSAAAGPTGATTPVGATRPTPLDDWRRPPRRLRRYALSAVFLASGATPVNYAPWRSLASSFRSCTSWRRVHSATRFLHGSTLRVRGRLLSIQARLLSAGPGREGTDACDGQRGRLPASGGAVGLREVLAVDLTCSGPAARAPHDNRGEPGVIRSGSGSR